MEEAAADAGELEHEGGESELFVVPAEVGGGAGEIGVVDQ